MELFELVKSDILREILLTSSGKRSSRIMAFYLQKLVNFFVISFPDPQNNPPNLFFQYDKKDFYMLHHLFAKIFETIIFFCYVNTVFHSLFFASCHF